MRLIPIRQGPVSCRSCDRVVHRRFARKPRRKTRLFERFTNVVYRKTISAVRCIFSLPRERPQRGKAAYSKTKRAHAPQIDDAMSTTREMVNRIRRELRYYRALLRDPRTPRVARWLIGAGVGYLLLPFDVVPDFIPIIGQLDDLIVVSMLVGLGMRFVPASVKRDVRLRTRPVRARDSEPCSPILCETEALPSRFGVRVTVLDSRPSDAHEEILRALLKLVFEERLVVLDRSIAREVLGPVCRVPGDPLPDSCGLRRIAVHPKEMLGGHDVEVESRKAPMQFIDMLTAYEALPARSKKMLDALRICPRAISEVVLHEGASSDHRRLSKDLHPLAPKHPVTNRRVLSPRLDECGIVGMTDEKGSRLLEELKRHARQSQFLYEHRCRSNDIVVWDATTMLNWSLDGSSEGSLARPCPVGRSGRRHDLHSTYRVLLRPARAASPSVASSRVH